MEKKNVVTIDPELWMERQLRYQEKHSGWAIFRTVYWGIYIFVFSLILIYYGYNNLPLNTLMISGYALLLLSVMLIIYGVVTSLHYKLIKKYG